MFVREWMSKGLITVAPNATLDEALKLMETKKIRRLPVVDNGKLVGIVTDRDLMKSDGLSHRDRRSGGHTIRRVDKPTR